MQADIWPKCSTASTADTTCAPSCRAWCALQFPRRCSPRPGFGVLSFIANQESRWHVELFLKWIKQHLRIKRFLGTSENAVKTQIWCAVSTYVLIAIVKKELHLNASLYTLLQILSVSVFEKTLISYALQPDTNR